MIDDAGWRRIRCRVGTRAGPAGGQLCFRVGSTVGARKAALGCPCSKMGRGCEPYQALRSFGSRRRLRMSLAWRSQWLLCKKAGSSGFGACVAKRASPSSPERTGPFGWGATYAQARKNQQLLVSYRPLARFFAWLAHGAERRRTTQGGGSLVGDTDSEQRAA